jgi:DNA polymerase (family 10)
MPASARMLNNAEIADRLSMLAQLMSMEKVNPYKVRAYRRAAATIRGMGESVDELVRNDSDLTIYAGIGSGISAAIRELVLSGTLKKLEELRSAASAEISGISEYPRLDPKRILRVYKKLGLSSIEELRSVLESGELERMFGVRMAQHVRQRLVPTHTILLYHAHAQCAAIQQFLLTRCGATRAEPAGDYRRSVEVISEFVFLVETPDFPQLVSKLERFGGRTPLVDSKQDCAIYSLPAGPLLRVQLAGKRGWGLELIRATGSRTHLRKLRAETGRLSALAGETSFASEAAFYKRFGLAFIPPELREGLDEVRLSCEHKLPRLVTEQDIRGDLHAHTVASDGADTLEDMASAARERGYEYLGITDHSQSLKIAGGLSIDDLRDQIRSIDILNGRLSGFRVLKSAEVDILADGSLDYPDDLLRELDYTVCSIHSRFSLGKEQQTERILRAMDNRFFTILGHATGRLLLKRPGYELDMDRIIEHARQRGCMFEINSSPDRLDLSCENARLVRQAGILIAISTDAHSTGEFGTIRYGIEQARRAGLDKTSVLNCQPLAKLLKLLRR